MWQKQKNKLYQMFKFKDFKGAVDFINKLAVVANNLNHHPVIKNDYNKVEVWLSTHEEGDTVTEKDKQFAKRIDMLMDSESDEPDDTPSLKEVKMYSDGGSRGNPGPSAWGFVIKDMDDNVVFGKGEYLGITTNNQAEYHSLKAGLKKAKALNAREVHVYMDSLLVINQMKGIFKVKNRELWPIYESIKELIKDFKKVHFNHVPRELNKLADAEVNKCLDSQT
jgi:ribonuclease HI